MQSSPAKPVSRTATAFRTLMQMLAVILLCLAVAVESIGGYHQIAEKEWRGGASLGVMVLGIFLLLLSRYLTAVGDADRDG